ncbi:MAG: TIGR04255 family protein [Planctomycetes bacterium]|nr:TIGR04255 family protein [Planctomycetota bacterium]
MPSRTQYSKAPITEAIIDIGVRPSESVRLDDLERLHDSIRDEYPGKAGRSLFQGRFRAERTGVSTSASQKPMGFLFKSRDEKQIVQMRLDGFTMSRLAPYESWKPFRDEAQRLWALYRDVVQPEEATRLAVRYINRIDIPLPFDDLKEYLLTVPEVAPGLPQALSGLFMQLTIPQEDIGCTTILTEALIEPPAPEVASVVVDIDLFRTERVPQDDGKLWAFFELLHDRKNQVFEACITDKTREMIQ